jgi:hypothetical protein
MKYQPDQSIVDYNDWDLATSSVITGDFTTDSLKYGFGPTTLRAESFNWLPKGNWVDLGYDNAPTESQLRSQIEAGDHNDPYGNLGCPNCGNIDLFWKKITSKGKTFRCLSCEWADNYETVKSQGDITLQKFGLTVDCPLCGETISAYNRASIDSHFRKHKKEAAESKVSEAENSEPEWQDDIKWNDKPKKKIEPEWDDVEWESETRKCCECGTTESLATIQAGTFCYECLPINLGAEADDYWAGSVAKAIVNEMGDDYYDEDLHEYNCVHFAQEMSGYLAQDGIPHEIQSIAGYGGEVAHAWVYVPSEKEYYDAWTPYGVSDWKDLGFWETLDYTPEWLEQQTPESFAAEEKQEVPRYVYHATPELYWEQIKEQGGMIPQIGYMTYRAFLPRYKQAHIGQDISPEHYKQWIVKELGGLKIWATSQSKVMIYASQIEPMSLLPDNVVLKIDTEGLDFQYYNYEEFFTQKPIPLSAIEVAFRINGERSKEEYPDYLLPNLDPSLQNILEDEPELLETHPELFRDENYERFVAAAEESFEAEDNYDSTYGKAQAKIRRKLKKKIKKQAIMGTKAGQWSARKSQELKRQYEAACSKKGLKPYKGQKTKKQQDLTDWSKQGWRTASGKKSSTTGEPYFPAKAVAALKQKKLYAKAKRQKQAATKAGKQNARYSDDIRAVVKQYRAEESKEVSPSQLLNWIAQPTVLRIKIPAEVKHEPLLCVMCSSRNLEANEMDRTGDGTIHSYVNCRDCGCVWREDFLYNDYEIIDEGQTTSLSSETIIDDEQLILEIEDIDESYGLDTPDSQILSIAESAVSQYLSRPDLPESFKLVSQPHFVFVVPDAFARSSHVARFRSQTASHIPIIMLSSEAIRESADRYGVSLETGVTTTVWHELGHVLCELWDMEEIYPFDDGNQEEEFAESIAESMYFQEPFQNPVF